MRWLHASIGDFWLPSRPPQCLAFIDVMLIFTTPRAGKSHGQSIRPIEICEAWLRLAAIVCLKMIHDASK
jgi:hypothetical protein